MARAPRPWFRFYVETIGDRKIRRLPPAQRWLWAAMMAAARESPQPGHLMIADGVAMTTRELAEYADVPHRSVQSALKNMQLMHMVTIESELISLTNWNARQFESDHVTARTQAYRERSKERSNGRSNDVSNGVPGNVYRNTPETETETDNRNTHLPATGGGTATRAETSPTPPPEFCENHPDGTNTACRACGRARTTRETWNLNQATTHRTDAEKRRRQQADAAINADLAPPRDPQAFRAARDIALAGIATAKTTTSDPADVPS